MTNKCKANETPACCCVDVGSIIDNDNESCTAEYEQIFESQAQAEAKLASLTQMARDVESDPCTITHSITKEANGYKLKAKFVFGYGAESLIFQLKLR